MKTVKLTKKTFSLTIILLAILTVPAIKSAANSLPAEIELTSGNLQVTFSKKFMYTINGIFYKGIPLKGDGFSGTVFNIKGTGFIGTGHTEHEDENVLSVKVSCDGKTVPLTDVSKQSIKGKSIRVEKQSKIRDFKFTNVTVIEGDALRESATITCSKDTSLFILYNFMHSWTNKMNDYMIAEGSGKVTKSTFVNDNKFPVRKKLRWVGFYSDKLHIGIITKLLKNSPDTNDKVFLWDRFNNNKFYLSSFFQKDFKAGVKATYEAVTRFYEYKGDDWSKEMQENAASLK